MSDSTNSGKGKMFLGVLIALFSILFGWLFYLLIFAYTDNFYLGSLSLILPILSFYISYKGKKLAKIKGKKGVMGTIGIMLSVISILLILIFMFSYEFLESFIENSDNFNIENLENEMNNKEKRKLFRRKK